MKKIKMEREKELQELKDKLYKMREDFDKVTISLAGASEFEKYLRLADEYNDSIAPIAHRIQELEDAVWEEIPEYGDLMTIKEFKSCCKSGGFIDYDGSGNYASKSKMSNKTICPSDVMSGLILKNPEFTHVIWFNK